MLLLAVDTATPAIAAGVLELRGSDARVLAERVSVDARAHGELLTPHILDAATDAGVALRDIEAIVCGSGPGPYTGLRAGMVTAASLAHGLGIPAYPVCSLDAIAMDTAAAEPFAVVTDARRKEVYWATYEPGGARTTGPEVQRPADVHTGCRLGAGQHAETAGLTAIEPEYPSARGLALAAARRITAGEQPDPLTPLYLRKPHAAEPAARKRVTA